MLSVWAYMSELGLEEDRKEEVAEELAPLSVQLGYALGRQGRTAEAVEIYEQVRGREGRARPFIGYKPGSGLRLLEGGGRLFRGVSTHCFHGMLPHGH